jgi:UDP-N-acetylmuramate dehydrogenase
MRIEHNYSLTNHNTFRVPAVARWFMEYENEEDLSRILKSFRSSTFLSVGEGSNLLFLSDFDGLIIHSRIKGITVEEAASDSVLLRIGAGERWDDVVAFAVSNGWSGIENLSHIPGQAGAAAVQNIGAYGVEMKNVLESVEACNQLTGRKHLFTNEACRYRYRHSLFKDADCEPYIITAIRLRLQKTPQFKIDYGDLSEALSGREISLQTVRDAVIQIRRSKLPDTDELSNAGSFFMNPVVACSQFDDLRNKYPTIPSYPAQGTDKKIPAGWLIEQCGFKGQREGNVGVYEKHALILVNFGGATGSESAAFADKIRKAVHDKFGVRLVPEVRYII